MTVSQATDESSNQSLTQVDSQMTVDGPMSDSDSIMSEDLCGLQEETQYDVIMETQHSGPPMNEELTLMALMTSESNLMEIKGTRNKEKFVSI